MCLEEKVLSKLLLSILTKNNIFFCKIINKAFRSKMKTVLLRYILYQLTKKF